MSELKTLVHNVKSHLSESLDYPVRVGSYDEDQISVFVDTYEVNEDPVGCMQEVTSEVESEFPELKLIDTECHEMVVVTFELV